MTTRVHLADDHTMFRQGLESILSSQERIEVVGSSSTGPEAAAQVATTRPDVIVTQLDMQPKTAAPCSRGSATSRRGRSPRGRPRWWCSPPVASPTA